MKTRSLKAWSYVVLTGPGLLIYASVIIFPVIFSVVLGFTSWDGLGAITFNGIDNYLRAFKDPVFWHGMRNNLLIVCISVFGQIPLGFILAYIIYRRLVKGTKFFETMIFLPIVINPVVLGVLWDYVFGPPGVVTALMRMIRHDPRYVFGAMEDPSLAIFPILFVILWVYTGLYMVIYIANLQKISPSVIEAAVIDGASEWQVLMRVIFPAMVGVLFTTGVFAISGSLSSFNLIYAMTGGGPAHYTEVIAIYQYINTFVYYHYGFGAALSVVIVILSVGLISVLNSILGRFERRYE
jgi:raffinose/stachyose/melibiose transport system permease protein